MVTWCTGEAETFVAFSTCCAFTKMCNKLLIPWISLVKRLD